jgi:presenilin-like A22 family membrane protease
MNKNKTKDKHEFIPMLLMGGLFVLIHGLALIVTSPFKDAGITPAFENPDNPLNIIFILLIMFFFTILILLIAKFWKKKLIQFIILGAIGYTAAYVFYPLYFIIIPGIIPFIFALISAILLIIILYKFPEWYIIDLSGIIIGAGAIAIFGMSLGVLLVILLLVCLAIYDAISVYKTKHMIDLADTVMDLKLPVLLVIPKIKNYSLIKETKSLKEKIKENKDRDAFFLGLGDIVMPGILVASVYNNIKGGLPIAISVIAGTIIGFAILMIFVIKGKPQAGLPSLCSGAIIAYIISSYIFFGEIVGLNIPF